jgi:hypothetical protein
MIPILKYQSFLQSVTQRVNTLHKKKISKTILAPAESSLVKKLKDESGIILAIKFPAADSDISTADDYAEANHCLLFLIEKVDPGKFSADEEIQHYGDLQQIMSSVKELLLEAGMNGDIDDEVVLSKTFRTEWEYQILGGFNGLSISFDLKDFRL